MPFRRHDARRRAQPGGVHLSTSSASLSSFSSTSSSIHPVEPPSNSSHSDIVAAHPSTFSAPQTHLPPDTILPVPRSSSLFATMGQAQSRSPPELPVPPPSPTVPVSSGGAGYRLKRVFGGRKKRSEDISPTAVAPHAPVPIGMEKSRSVMTPSSSSSASSPSAPKLPQQPSVSAGPGYPATPFTRRVPTEHASVPFPKPPLESPLPSDQRSSSMTSTLGVSAAIRHVSETENAEGVANVVPRPNNRDSDHDVMKEDWRKSDSTTTSYYTVRPRSGASGGTRTPRPVSMAESLQSTSTVVPAGRRLSALLTEAEFIMTEEGGSRSSSNPLCRKTSPSGPSKTRKRHSISLSFTSPLPSNPPATSTTRSEGHSSTTKPAFDRRPSDGVATLHKATASGIIGSLHSGDFQSGGAHNRGDVSASSPATSGPSSLPQQPSPSGQHGSLRQTAITMTSGLAPAAGFAMGFGKRAVERVGRALGSLGSSHNSSGHSSSSSSIGGADDFGRNASSVSLASHVSQAQGTKGKQRRTPNAPSGAWSVNTLSSTSTGQTDPESFGFTGPSLGNCLRGPMRNSSGGFVIGGLVFGRDLKTCVHDTAIDAVRLAPPSPDSSPSGEASCVSASVGYIFIVMCSPFCPTRAAVTRASGPVCGTPYEMGCRRGRSLSVR